MSRWLGWRWEFDGSNSTWAGNGGVGLWSPVDCFGVGGGYDCGGENELRGNDWGVVCGVLWTVLLWAGQRLFWGGGWCGGERTGWKKWAGQRLWERENRLKNEKAREGKKTKSKIFISTILFIKNLKNQSGQLDHRFDCRYQWFEAGLEAGRFKRVNGTGLVTNWQSDKLDQLIRSDFLNAKKKFTTFSKNYIEI